ncbi:MAG: hypothetical protein FJ271_16265 [Planctomycetes bacterium]|nr:hypothetical protein [Planctomycetota bacterium]
MNTTHTIIALLSMVLFVAPQGATAQEKPVYRLATFAADVTPPLGSPLLGGVTVVPPTKAVDDSLSVLGFVLLGGDQPIVVAAIDWCEVRNDAYDRWREALAEAAGTTRERVLFSAIHQHDTPLADLEAQRILDRAKLGGALIGLDYHEMCVRRAARAVKEAVARARPVTHFGVGKARVEKVASNRRYLGKDGKPRFDRSSMSGGDPFKRDAPDGVIDPWLRTISFWNGDKAVAALSVYAVHPMSRWGTGRVTADFPGLARKRRQADLPGVLQIYASGCSGNVTPGKYNDGNLENRPVLADRVYQAMAAAWKATQRRPITQAGFRNVPFRLEARDTAGFKRADLDTMLEDRNEKKRNLAAMGLSCRKRFDAGQKIDLPVLDLGAAQVLLLPGECYVEFQLAAQKMRPDTFVVTLGYGECATGYLPPDSAWAENDGNLTPWCWIARGADKVLTEAMRKALKAK